MKQNRQTLIIILRTIMDYKHTAIFFKIFLLCSSLRSEAYSKIIERDRYMLYCFNIM